MKPPIWIEYTELTPAQLRLRHALWLIIISGVVALIAVIIAWLVTP